MIKCNNGNVELNGSASTLLADLTEMVKAMRKTLEEDFTKEKVNELIEKTYKIAKMTDEEYEEYMVKKIKELIKGTKEEE